MCRCTIIIRIDIMVPVFRNPNTRTRKPTDNQHKATGQAETECRTKQCARQPTTPYQRLINIYTLTPPAFPSIPTYQPSLTPSLSNQPTSQPSLPPSLPTYPGWRTQPPSAAQRASAPAHAAPRARTPPARALDPAAPKVGSGPSPPPNTGTTSGTRSPGRKS